MQGDRKGWFHTLTLVNTDEALKLTAKTTIQLLSLDRTYFKELKSVNKEIILEVIGISNNIRYFKCVILLAGETVKDNIKSYQIDFAKMRYGILEKRVIGALLPEYNLKSLDAKHINYFVNIEIKEEIKNDAHNFIRIANNFFIKNENEKVEIPNFSYQRNGKMALENLIYFKNTLAMPNNKNYVSKFNLNKEDVEKLRKYHERIMHILKKHQSMDFKEKRDDLKNDIPHKTAIKQKAQGIFWLKNMTYKHQYWRLTFSDFTFKVRNEEILTNDFHFADEIKSINIFLRDTYKGNYNNLEWEESNKHFILLLKMEYKRFIKMARKEKKKLHTNIFNDKNYPSLKEEIIKEEEQRE